METIDFNQVLTDNISVVEGLLDKPLPLYSPKAGNLNFLTKTSIFSYYTESPENNSPITSVSVLVLVINRGDIADVGSRDHIFQMVIGTSNKLFIRHKTGDVWSGWKEIITK